MLDTNQHLGAIFMTKKRRKPRKFSEADKLQIVAKVRTEGQTIVDVAKNLDIDVRQVRRWVNRFDVLGPSCFAPIDSKKTKDLSFRLMVLRDMYVNNLSLEVTALRHGITLWNVQIWRDKYINIVSKKTCENIMKEDFDNPKHIEKEIIELNKKIDEGFNRTFESKDEEIACLKAQVVALKKSIVLTQEEGHLFWSRKRRSSKS